MAVGATICKARPARMTAVPTNSPRPNGSPRTTMPTITATSGTVWYVVAATTGPASRSTRQNNTFPTAAANTPRISTAASGPDGVSERPLTGVTGTSRSPEHSSCAMVSWLPLCTEPGKNVAASSTGQRETCCGSEPEQHPDGVDVAAGGEQYGYPDHAEADADPSDGRRRDAAHLAEDGGEQWGHRAQDRHDGGWHAALGGGGADRRDRRQAGQHRDSGPSSLAQPWQATAGGHQDHRQARRTDQGAPHGDLARGRRRPARSR